MTAPAIDVFSLPGFRPAAPAATSPVALVPAAPAFVPDANPIGGSLSERTMNVDLTLRAWSGKRVNAQLSREVASERKAEKDAVSAVVHLVPKQALDPVQKAHTAARARNYALTLPWGEKGVRILSAAAFFEYQQAMNEERLACEQAHRAFVQRYPDYLASAPARLGAELYRASDFPAERYISHLFSFELAIMPVPERNDFRVALGKEYEQEVRAGIEQTVQQRFEDAQRELWNRMVDTTRHFARALADADFKFKDSTVTKLTELARLAPKLSLAPSDEFSELCAELATLTSNNSPKELRDNAVLRSNTAADATRALRKLEAAMEGAF